MQTLYRADFEAMERRYRATFFNTLSGYKSISLVGTASAQPNLAIFNSVFHVGANPAALGLVFRPDTVERHTLNNILDQGRYTINHITPAFFRQAHQTSAKYPAQVSEFEACGLTPVFREGNPAPYVGESPVQIGLSFAERIDIRLNGTIIIVGTITDVSLDTTFVEYDGFVRLEDLGTITSLGLDAYFTTSGLGRLPYARVDNPVI
jgi:flavin reductase (DIM6/NTAB) family NADH-FMN oxidoreductase RutF